MNGSYVICAPAFSDALTGRDFADLIERFLQRSLGSRVAPNLSRSTPAA
jgi:hypothetical protein